MNLTTISNENFLKISYYTFYTGINDHNDHDSQHKSSSNTSKSILPKLEAWKFVEFTNKGLKVKLNYSNPLLVSQSQFGKDKLVFVFKIPELF